MLLYYIDNEPSMGICKSTVNALANRKTNPTWIGVKWGFLAYLILFGLCVLFITHHPDNRIGNYLPMPIFLMSIGAGILMTKRARKRFARKSLTAQ